MTGGIGNIILVVIFLIFILAILAATFGGFGSESDEARRSAVEIADGIAMMKGVGPIFEADVHLSEGWCIQLDYVEKLIQVLEEGKLDEAYRFNIPGGYDTVCCPKFDTAEDICATFCPEPFSVEGKVDETFCVATMAKIDSFGIGDETISQFFHENNAIYVYPKGLTCTTAAI